MIRWIVSARIPHLLVNIGLSRHLLESYNLKVIVPHKAIVDHTFDHACFGLELIGGKRWLLALCLY